MIDVAIVGGGPAGLSAALVLGRACRSVVLCDEGRARNAAAHGVQNFLTRDGMPPQELRRVGREQAESLGVELLLERVEHASVVRCDRHPTAFRLVLTGGQAIISRKLLLATGVVDVLPDVPGLREHYGRGVHHCPYCDAYQYRGKRIAALARGEAAAGLALALATWSPAVTACIDGGEIGGEYERRLERSGIALCREPVARIEGDGARVTGVSVKGGAAFPCDAVFFNTDAVQRSPLAEMLGCRYDDRDQVQTSDRQGTGVPGLFLAGDADGDVQFAIVAAAEGATAAVAINREMQDEDRA